MSIFQARLKKKMEVNQMSPSELSKITGITKASISQYLNGVYEAKQNNLYLLAKALNCTPAYLMGWEDEPRGQSVEDKTNAEKSITLTAPLQGREAAHLRVYRQLNNDGKDVVDDYTTLIAETPKYTDTPLDKVQTSIIYFDTPVSAGTGQYLDNDSYIMLDLMEKPPKGAEFVVRVCGDSMEPTYKDGDKLYIEPMQQIEKGDIGIFSINGDVFVKECGDGVLISHNPKYKPIPLDESDNLHCFGKVIGTCKKYR